MTGKKLAKRLLWGIVFATIGIIILFVLTNTMNLDLRVGLVAIPMLFIIGFLLGSSKEIQRVVPPLSSDDLQSSLDDLLAHVKEKDASKAIVAKVESIRSSILNTLPSIPNLSDNTNKDIYLLRKVALEYLPNSLNNYLKMPFKLRRGETLKDGKTAHDLMLEQLTLLDREMHGIFESVTKQETDSLRVHGRYLEQLFEETDLFVP